MSRITVPVRKSLPLIECSINTHVEVEAGLSYNDLSAVSVKLRTHASSGQTSRIALSADAALELAAELIRAVRSFGAFE